MKIIVTLLSLVAIAVAYDDLNDAYFSTLANDLNALRLLMNCLIDKGPCDDFGKHTKAHMVEALKDGCNECDVTQKHFVHILIRNLKSKLPELYDEYEQKYDPKRILLDVLDEKIKKY